MLKSVAAREAGEGRGLGAKMEVLIIINFDLESIVHVELVVINVDLAEASSSVGQTLQRERMTNSGIQCLGQGYPDLFVTVGPC